MDDGLVDSQSVFGFWLGAVLAGLTFLGAWAYCASEYGFLWGFGFGWMASGIAAAIVYAFFRYLWRMVLLLMGIAFLIVLVANR